MSPAIIIIFAGLLYYYYAKALEWFRCHGYRSGPAAPLDR